MTGSRTTAVIRPVCTLQVQGARHLSSRQARTFQAQDVPRGLSPTGPAFDASSARP